MTFDVETKMLNQRQTMGSNPRMIPIANNEVMFRTVGSCNGEVHQAFFVTKDLHDALPVNQAHWILNHQATDFALIAVHLPKRGET